MFRHDRGGEGLCGARYTGRVNRRAASQSTSDYPGKKYGFPQSGRGSVAPVIRRLVALFIDWGVAFGLSVLFFNNNEWVTLGLYTLQVLVMLPLFGYTLGYLICGILLMSTSGRKVNVVRVLVRHVLFCLIIPPLIYDPDRRGLHDLAAGAVVVRR